MQSIIAGIFELPSVRSAAERLDDNIFFLGAAASLVLSLVLWIQV